jgi:hypothetical protein
MIIDWGLCCFSIFMLGFMAYVFWKIYKLPWEPKPSISLLKVVKNGSCPEHGNPLKYCKECVKHMKEDWNERRRL